jgi:hypothetical protein
MLRFVAAAFVVLVATPAARAQEGCVATARFINGDWTLAKAKAFVRDVTYRSYSWGHGNQIEHASADGRVYLWYPGNRVILPGRYDVRVVYPNRCPTNGNVVICFAYGANTYNPVTKHSGPGWECTMFRAWAEKRSEVVPGDPLGLARMKVPPFPLETGYQSIAQLAARLRR